MLPYRHLGKSWLILLCGSPPWSPSSLLWTTIVVHDIIQQFKSTIESLQKELSELKSQSKDIKDLPNLVQEPQDGISHDISGVSTGPVTTKTVQASVTADSKKKDGKTHYDDHKFNMV